jgi:hypothetical protein
MQWAKIFTVTLIANRGLRILPAGAPAGITEDFHELGFLVVTVLPVTVVLSRMPFFFSWQ